MIEFSSCIPYLPVFNYDCSDTRWVGYNLSTQAVYLIFHYYTTFQAITGGVGNDLSTQAVT